MLCYQGRTNRPVETTLMSLSMSQTTHLETSLSANNVKIPPPRPHSGLLLLASVIFGWGISWPIGKIALEEIDPWTFRTLCLIIAGPGLFALAKMGGLSLAITSRERKPIALAALLNVTGWFLCSAYGLAHLQAGRAAVIGSTMPLWATIMAKFVLKEQLTYERLVGLRPWARWADHSDLARHPSHWRSPVPCCLHARRSHLVGCWDDHNEAFSVDDTHYCPHGLAVHSWRQSPSWPVPLLFPPANHTLS